jgi:hypothetical protein
MLERGQARVTLAIEGWHFQFTYVEAPANNALHYYVIVRKQPQPQPQPQQRLYIGKLAPNGVFLATRTCPIDALVALCRLNAAPTEAARLYSHQTGNCSYCGKRLDNAASVAVGYGPICAEKYGLPYGEAHVPNEAEEEQQTNVQ